MLPHSTVSTFQDSVNYWTLTLNNSKGDYAKAFDVVILIVSYSAVCVSAYVITGDLITKARKASYLSIFFRIF